MTRKGSTTRTALALLTGLVLALAGVPSTALAVTPIDGGEVTVLPFAINVSSGDQYDPHTPIQRSNPAIGSNTVAFIDRLLSPVGELYVSDIGGATVRVTNDTAYDDHPQVAPSGNLVVYESCASSLANCDIHQAARS